MDRALNIFELIIKEEVKRYESETLDRRIRKL